MSTSSYWDIWYGEKDDGTGQAEDRNYTDLIYLSLKASRWRNHTLFLLPHGDPG